MSREILVKVLLAASAFISLPVAAEERSSELNCLVLNIFMEARGESSMGMQAVADVTLNRVKHPSFPDSVCGVVFQPKQFSWNSSSNKAYNGDLRGLSEKDIAAYQSAKQIATAALSEGYKPILPNWVVSFHNQGVSPSWARTMRKYGTIGNHTFFGYKTKGAK